MKRVPTHVVKERTREVSALFRSYEPYGGLVGTEQQALVTDANPTPSPIPSTSPNVI